MAAAARSGNAPAANPAATSTAGGQSASTGYGRAKLARPSGISVTFQ